MIQTDNIDPQIGVFLEMMAAERGAVALTLEAYRRDLVEFGTLLVRRGATPSGASTELIRAYLSAQARAGLSTRTVARRC